MSSCAVQGVAIDHGASEGVGGIRKPYLSDGTLWARDEQHVSTRCGVVAMRGDVPAALITRPVLGQIPDDQFSLLRRVVVLYRRSQPWRHQVEGQAGDLSNEGIDAILLGQPDYPEALG